LDLDISRNQYHNLHVAIGHNKGKGKLRMANLTIELPDDLARRLATIAAAEHKSIQQLTLERLRSLVESGSESGPGSAPAVLRAMKEPPHLGAADVDELDAAIAAGRLPVRARELFKD
jgi:plasmid stability protein